MSLFSVKHFALIASVALCLSACTKKVDPNLYGASMDKTFAVLAHADVPKNILVDPGMQAALESSVDSSPYQSIRWSFDKFGHPLMTAEAHLAAEGSAATRLTVDIHMLDTPALAALPEGKSLAALANALPNLKELLRLNFTEWVDATLTARPYEGKAGQAYSAAHQEELTAERQKYEAALAEYTQAMHPAKPASAPPGIPTPSAAPPSDPTAPMLVPKPSGDGRPLFSPPPQTAPSPTPPINPPNGPAA